MTATFTYRARCGEDFDVLPCDEGLVLQAGCKTCGVDAGEVLYALKHECGNCKKAKVVEPEKATVPMSKVAPTPKKEKTAKAEKVEKAEKAAPVLPPPPPPPGSQVAGIPVVDTPEELEGLNAQLAEKDQQEEQVERVVSVPTPPPPVSTPRKATPEEVAELEARVNGVPESAPATVPPPPAASPPPTAMPTPPPPPVMQQEEVEPVAPPPPTEQPPPAEPVSDGKKIVLPLSATLPQAAGSALLSELMAGAQGEDAVDVDAVLASIPGLEGGPSQGGISWHSLEPCQQCWRKAYFKHVMGLQKRQRGKHFAFGSMYHACWELWYRYGGQRAYDEVCDAVRQAGAPKLAGEVQRLVYAELQRYSKEESETWDTRAVEANAIFWSEPVKIDGKTVYIPFTCRHDMILAKHEAGQPCAPPGPVKHGVYVLDRKTASAMTYEVTKGFGMDGQFRMNALVFEKSDEREKFGPLNGILVAVGVKHKNPDPYKSFFRIEAPIDDDQLAEFYRDEVMTYGTELYRRLASKRYREDRSLWPKKTSSCVFRYGCCDFFDLCDVGGDGVIDATFKVDETRILDVEKFAPPPMEVKRKAVEAKTPPEKKAAKTEKTTQKKYLSDIILKTFSDGVQTFDAFKPGVYLVPDHTEKSVMTALENNLRGAWPIDTEFDMQSADGEETFHLKVDAKAIIWTHEKAKGRMTYKAIAKTVCTDWWNIDQLKRG